jgi:hypothetical protein
MVRFTIHISSFREIRDSRFYLDLKKFEMQCWFWCCSLIQMLTMPWNDEGLRLFGSLMLEKSHSSICHGWACWKAELERAVTTGKWRLKKLPKVDWMMEEWRLLEFLQGFLQNFCFGQNARWECVCIFCWGAAKTRVGFVQKQGFISSV